MFKLASYYTFSLGFGECESRKIMDQNYSVSHVKILIAPLARERLVESTAADMKGGGQRI